MIDFLLEKYNEFSSSGLNSSIVGLLIIFALFGFLKGAVKMVFLVCTISGAVFAAYWGSESGLDFIRQHWAQVPAISGNVIGAICGIIAFVILSKIFGFLANPFEQNRVVSKFGSGVPAAIVSFGVAAVIVWFGINQLRDKGTQEEMRYWISQNSDQPMEKIPVLAKLKNKFENSVMGKRISSVYHMQDDEQHNLARIVVLANYSREKLRELQADPDVKQILSNRKVRELLTDTPDIQRGIAENNPRLILENPRLLETLKDPQLRGELRAVSNKLLKLNQEQ